LNPLGGKARSEGGALSVSEFEQIGSKVWSKKVQCPRRFVFTRS
jgi:hypothetical protein